MQWIVALPGYAPVCLHGGHYVRCLKRQDDVPEAEGLKVLAVPEYCPHHKLGHGDILLAAGPYRAGVDPYPDCNPPVLCGAHHLYHLALVLHVAGVDAYLVHALLNGIKGHTVAEVDIGYQRDADLSLNLPQALCGLPGGYGHPDYLTAYILKFFYLVYGGLYIGGMGLGHGLQGYRGIAPDLHTAHLYGPRPSSFHHLCL